MMRRIVFLHGLESGPTGSKALWLRERYDTLVPLLDTRAAIESRDQAVASGEMWTHRYPATAQALEQPLAAARSALAFEPELVIGSSFGGALLLELLHEGIWNGPSLFLAGAGLLLTKHRSLPPHVRSTLIHGRLDEVVPLQDSRELARTGGPFVQLWEVGDDHRLATILEDGTLEAAIAHLLNSLPHAAQGGPAT